MFYLTEALLNYKLLDILYRSDQHFSSLVGSYLVQRLGFFDKQRTDYYDNLLICQEIRHHLERTNVVDICYNFEILTIPPARRCDALAYSSITDDNY